MEAALKNVIVDTESVLAELKKIADRATELVDQLPKIATGLTVEQHATVAIAVKDARDAVSKTKARLTNAQQECDRWFALRIQESQQDTIFRTESHTFSAGAKAYVSAPSQNRHPKEFQALMDWLKANHEGDRIEIDHLGHVTLDAKIEPVQSHKDQVLNDAGERPESFQDFCEALLNNGRQLPPHVGAHMVDAVTIRRRG